MGKQWDFFPSWVSRPRRDLLVERTTVKTQQSKNLVIIVINSGKLKQHERRAGKDEAEQSSDNIIHLKESIFMFFRLIHLRRNANAKSNAGNKIHVLFFFPLTTNFTAITGNSISLRFSLLYPFGGSNLNCFKSLPEEKAWVRALKNFSFFWDTRREINCLYRICPRKTREENRFREGEQQNKIGGKTENIFPRTHTQHRSVRAQTHSYSPQPAQSTEKP